MHEITTHKFSNASAAALADTKLQGALKKVMGHFDEARRDAVTEITPEVWETLRSQAQKIKAHTINNLDYYLDMLHRKVSENGGEVHFAKDSTEANRIVANIARNQGANLVIKSKSMVSEEMRLNDMLAQEGVEAVETDLGEYIIQLADETPFHIIAPAMHKTKEEVSELFAQKIDRPNLNEIPELAQAAREELREKFLKADIGITGANFIVAETGTQVIITNEGNGRMCTSAPRTHIAITGMEKVIPSLSDLAVFLRLLPRSATGQSITSYVSMASGPKRTSDEDGPDQFHLIIVDNGRSNLLRNAELKEALNCIRCGACLNVCPVYTKVGGHAYGWVYPGPIGAIVSPMLVGLSKAKDLPFASTLCGACRDVCPVKIDLPRMLLSLRTQLMENKVDGHRNVTTWERILDWGYTKLMSNPTFLTLVRKFVRVAQLPLTKQGKIRRIPIPPFSIWTKSKDLPPIPAKSFRQIWSHKQSHGEKDL